MIYNPFINNTLLSHGPWQAMERSIARLMLHEGFEDVRLVGRTGDKGADILASMNGNRWVVQVKFRQGTSLGEYAVDEILNAMKIYNAKFPVVVSNGYVTTDVQKRQKILMADGINLQIWDKPRLLKRFERLNEESPRLKDPRDYQMGGIKNVVNKYLEKDENRGLVVMATGLGKTFIAAESVRQLTKFHPGKIKKILVLAHTNELVYQLEKSFWPCLSKNLSTAIWNGIEKGDVENSFITFACVDSLTSFKLLEIDYSFDLIIIDEAHHAGSKTYKEVIKNLKAGQDNGPFLLGLTATPWRADEEELSKFFGPILCNIDIIEGMKKGYLANVDYRMHVDNIDWKSLSKTKSLTPKGLNRTIFIKEWDDAVIDILQKTWAEVKNPRCIVFCSTIDHAMTIRDKINSRNFTRAESIYSGNYAGKKMNAIERNIVLNNFADGRTNIICSVDIFNEGIDVPDVNILVFQRVTHSRRIFIQQLGRGLRITEGKNKVIVLDFVSDIRRFAAGIDINNKLKNSPRYIELGTPVKFVNKTGEDKEAETFLKVWLDDVTKIESSGENDYVLKFPPLELVEDRI